uniref:RING-type domain-containing protein n=1 Tax=Oryzias latipes TaxID=8090 RepID=A0A3P9KFN2_ORYLA
MEEHEQSRLEELLTCPVCQDIFIDPRQLPCGHSMCLSCLNNLLDHSSDSPLRCPDCRAQFRELCKSRRVATVLYLLDVFDSSLLLHLHFFNLSLQETLAKKVYCDCCSESKTLAFKTCLKCEVSMCKEHVRNHLELPAFTGHPLVGPLSDLAERKCPQHEDEVNWCLVHLTPAPSTYLTNEMITFLTALLHCCHRLVLDGAPRLKHISAKEKQ